jgi:tRNA G18 (ribose-2'-O)-methylase SpoU
MVTDAARAALGDVFAARPEVPVYVVPQAVVQGITGVNIHRGCLAIGERPAPIRWQHVVRDAARVVVLERVTNADNVGGIFRNAAAFGANAVLLDAVSTDPLYRKAIRTSMGAALHVPFARADRLPHALIELRERGFTTVALTPDPSAPAIGLGGRDLAGARLAFVLGHEGEGLTTEVLEACERRLRIPMAAGVDSLNVATAAAIALSMFR